ncbi:hypothetical protein FS749_007196 [Ceratobasidium sp. UAMH 11750]|nr:hypothetical protein FS749_007196 [Ceratobasidium sp. UAMH 11750]
MTYPLADIATSTSAPTAVPVQEGQCAPPCLDCLPGTSSDLDTTVRKRPTRSSSQVSSSGLSSSLYGRAPVAFMGTSDYQFSARSPQGDELEPMNSKEDIARIVDLIRSFPVIPKDSFRHALNEQFTKSNLVNCLTKLRRLLGPRFYYFGGHADWREERGEFDYLFGHDAKSGNVNDPARRISSTELSGLLVDPASPIPTQMILITDVHSHPMITDMN